MVIVAGYWACVAIVNLAFDWVISTTFMITAGASLLALLVFGAWWLASRRIPLGVRLVAILAAVCGAVGAVLFSVETLGALGAILTGLPLMLTAWTGWLLATRRIAWPTRRNGLVVVILLVWVGVAMIRVDGVDGKMMPSVHWRWTPTEEEIYLGERAADDQLAAGAAIAGEPLAVAPGDWPGFRGPGGLGEQQHEAIATNWTESPPKLLWKRRIGPAWSSFVVLGDRLFTQEQRGEDEATVCLDAATGKEIWSHVNRARFWDGQAGAGPRARRRFTTAGFTLSGRRASSIASTRPAENANGPTTWWPKPAHRCQCGAFPARR